MSAQRLVFNEPTWLDTLAAWLLALLLILPLAYAVWTAFLAPEYSTRFTLLAPRPRPGGSCPASAAPAA